MTLYTLSKHMTAEADAETAESSKVGRALTKSFTSHLQRTENGKTRFERLLELEELDPRCYTALRLKEQRLPAREIQRRMDCSLATVYNLLKRAKDVVNEGLEPESEDYEARLLALEVQDKQAHTVYVLQAYGWKQQSIANLLDVTASTVDHASRKARKLMGSPRYRVLDRYWDRTLDLENQAI